MSSFPTTPAARPFRLLRHTDVTGVSGTGHVADGVQWPDGTATVRWRGDRPSTVHWDDVAHAIAIHGHGGATVIEWEPEQVDAALAVRRESFKLVKGELARFRKGLASAEGRLGRIGGAHSKNVIEGGLTSGECDECGHPWPCPTSVWATTDRSVLETWDPADDEVTS